MKRKIAPTIGLGVVLVTGFIFGGWLLVKAMGGAGSSALPHQHAHANLVSMPGMDMPAIDMPIVSPARPLLMTLLVFVSVNAAVVLGAVVIRRRNRDSAKLRPQARIAAASNAGGVS
jgi:hypothetical protein